MPAPDHSVFFTGQMPFQPPNKQHQSTEGIAAEDKQKLAATKAKFCPARLPLVKHLFIKWLICFQQVMSTSFG